MFLDQLEIIPVIAQTRSFSKAAKLLHLSQPAISSKVQAMEDYYGVKFFHRTAQGVTLTEAGKILAAYASRFLDMQKAMDKDLQQLTHPANPSLVIGASCTAGNYAMPCSIRAFKEKYPKVNIKLDIANTATILNKLVHKEVDVAVAEGIIDNPYVVVHHLDIQKLVLICPPCNTGKTRHEISLRELKARPFVVREKGAAIHGVLEKAFSPHGYSLKDFHVVTEMSSIHSVKAAVQGGLGYSIVPKIAVQDELKEGTLRTMSIKEIDSLTIDINLVYRINEDPLPIAQKFIRFLLHPQQSGFCWNLREAV